MDIVDSNSSAPSTSFAATGIAMHADNTPSPSTLMHELKLQPGAGSSQPKTKSIASYCNTQLSKLKQSTIKPKPKPTINIKLPHLKTAKVSTAKPLRAAKQPEEKAKRPPKRQRTSTANSDQHVSEVPLQTSAKTPMKLPVQPSVQPSEVQIGQSTSTNGAGAIDLQPKVKPSDQLQATAQSSATINTLQPTVQSHPITPQGQIVQSTSTNGAGAIDLQPTVQSPVQPQATAQSSATNVALQPSVQSHPITPQGQSDDLANLRADIVGVNAQRPDLADFHNRLLDMMDKQKTRSDHVINELLKNKSTVAEASANAEMAVTRVKKVEAEVNLVDDKVERLRRSSDVLLRGIPLTGRESNSDLYDILECICSAINCQISNRDVEYVRALTGRQHSREQQVSRMLLVRFATVAIRRDFFDLYLEMNGGLRVSCLGNNNSNEKIFVSDNLTTKNATIRRRAAVLQRQGHIESQTVRDGLVHVVLNGNNNRRYQIHTVSELEGLVRHGPPEQPTNEQYDRAHGVSNRLLNFRVGGQVNGGHASGNYRSES